MLEGAVAAARDAGELMKFRIGADIQKTKYNPKDLLTEVDAQCQKIVEDVVAKQVLRSLLRAYFLFPLFYTRY